MWTKTKKFLRSFTPYQVGYLASVLVLTAAFVLFFPELMLTGTGSAFVTACSVVAVLANPVCELLISKQSKLNFLVDIFFIELPELVLCIAMGWYTIALITMVFWVPVDIFSYLRWKDHPDEQEEDLTVVKQLGPKKTVLAIGAILLFTLVMGRVMGSIPGAESSYLDAMASACGMANGILLLLRYTEQWYAWFLTLVLYTILYTASGAYIMLVTVAAMAVNTCYGYYKWVKYTHTHGTVQKD